MLKGEVVPNAEHQLHIQGKYLWKIVNATEELITALEYYAQTEDGEVARNALAEYSDLVSRP